MAFLPRLALRVIALAPLLATVLGDPNDWVNVEYVISQAKDQGGSATVDAKATIVRNAGSSAKKGPWTITNSKGNLPPSKDPHDYLSWAPYHWPNCNWCTQAGRTHLAHNISGSGQNISDNSSSSSYLNDPYSNEAVLSRRVGRQSSRIFDLDLLLQQGEVPGVNSSPNLTTELLTTLPTNISKSDRPSMVLPAPASTSSRSGKTPAPAKAAAKTTKASCTPSPTKTLAPSATWTTCSYIERDGQVNPDVRELNGPDAINDVAQSVIYNAVAYVLENTATYSQNVVNMINIFFLAPATKMNPNMNFGQVVRGPGLDGVSGTFTGVLDLRGLVKVINGIAILKAAGSPDWTQALDQQMSSWLTEYVRWLDTSAIGQKTASRPNNHGTLYVSQVAAAKFVLGDHQGAAVDLQHFCSSTFLDQVARSGEQPFEAVRTRPYHYRNFNLEALITNAKIGDQIGLNLWSCKSRYGATIQTALDFLLTVKPGNEDVSQIFPHVASVAAAYGDPTGKYAAFLKTKDPNYQSKPYWFYDQRSAIPSSSAKQSQRFSRKRDNTLGATPDVPNIPFECPAVFDDAVKVQIDNNVFVTCDELQPYYYT